MTSKVQCQAFIPDAFVLVDVAAFPPTCPELDHVCEDLVWAVDIYMNNCYKESKGDTGDDVAESQ
jgi:hypothetical protein